MPLHLAAIFLISRRPPDSGVSRFCDPRFWHPMSILTDGSESPEVRARQVDLLFAHLPAILLATSLNSAILTLTLWNHISHSVVALSWLACIQLTAFLRCILLLRYRRNPAGGNWGRWFFLGSLVSGICWGAAGVLLFTPGSVPHQTFLTFVLGGMSAGAVTTLAASFRVVLAYLIPGLLPLTVRLFSEGGQLHVAMGGMVGLFLILMVNISWRWYRSTMALLTLEVANGQLIHQLESEIAERQQIEENLRNARDSLEERVRERTAELQQALDSVKVLRGLLPICSSCKKIRDDHGYWTQLETYIHLHSEADFTHGLCPDCAERLFEGYIEQFS